MCLQWFTLCYERVKGYVWCVKAYKSKDYYKYKIVNMLFTSNRKCTRLPQTQNNRKSHDQCINLYSFYFFLYLPLAFTASLLVLFVQNKNKNGAVKGGGCRRLRKA